MYANIHEEEIKIEYNESFESDPLCEKVDAISAEMCNVPVGYLTSFTEEYENPSINNNASVTGYDSPDPDFHQDNLQDNITVESPSTWYREIDQSGKFVCKFCDLTYSTIQTIRHHIKSKHPDNANMLKNLIKNNKRKSKLKCHICKKQFKHINNLKEHVKEHNSENLLKSCKECCATFNNEQEMIHHLFQNHQNIPNTKIYCCATCGYQTRKLSHFKQHKNTHLIIKNIKCNYCDYATNYLPNLKIHQRIHTNEKPYVCLYKDCGYRCTAKSALRSHQLKHNPEENMVYCDRCTYKTVYKHSLKKHIGSHERNSLTFSTPCPIQKT